MDLLCARLSTWPQETNWTGRMNWTSKPGADESKCGGGGAVASGGQWFAHRVGGGWQGCFLTITPVVHTDPGPFRRRHVTEPFLCHSQQNGEVSEVVTSTVQCDLGTWGLGTTAPNAERGPDVTSSTPTRSKLFLDLRSSQPGLNLGELFHSPGLHFLICEIIIIEPTTESSCEIW